jgi:hypothetical protein
MPSVEQTLPSGSGADTQLPDSHVLISHALAGSHSSLTVHSSWDTSVSTPTSVDTSIRTSAADEVSVSDKMSVVASAVGNWTPVSIGSFTDSGFVSEQPPISVINKTLINVFLFGIMSFTIPSRLFVKEPF